MVRLSVRLCFVLLLLVLPFSLAQEQDGQEDCVYYFTSNDCPTCAETDTLLDTLAVKYPGLQVVKFEAYFNQENAQLLRKYFNTFKIPEESRGIPVVFLQGGYLIGDDSIQQLLEGRIIENTNPACPVVEEGNMVGIVGEEISPQHVIKTLTFAKVTGTALFQSIFSATLALFLVFLALLSTIKKDQVLVKRGILFIIIAYGIYLLSGMGLLPVFSAKVSSVLSKIIALIVIVMSIPRIRQFFGPKKARRRTEHEEKKTWQQKLEEFCVSSWGFITISLVTSFFLLGSSTRVVEILRNVFSTAGSQMVALPFIVYYNLLLMVPLLILLAVFFVAHITVEKHVQKEVFSDLQKVRWREHYHKVLRFIAGIVMFILGVIVFFF